MIMPGFFFEELLFPTSKFLVFQIGRLHLPPYLCGLKNPHPLKGSKASTQTFKVE